MTEETEETETRSYEPMVVSLDLELATLSSVVRGAEILADLEIRQGLMDAEMERDTPESLLAILALVGGRFEQVRRVLRGEEDPALIWAPHNAVSIPESTADVDGDILLLEWKCSGKPLVIARPSAWGLTPEEREARRALDMDAPKRKSPEVRKAPKGAKEKRPAPESSADQGEAPDVATGKDPAPDSPGSQKKGPKGTLPNAH